ncbi:MAG: hypothetical protein ABIA63_11015, partial [bacterium]
MKNKFGDFLFKTFIGALVLTAVVFISGFLNPGSYNGLAFVFMVTVYCTAGIGLILWIYVAYVIGSIAVGIYEAHKKSKVGTDAGESKTEAASGLMNIKDQVAIIGYIESSKIKG